MTTTAGQKKSRRDWWQPVVPVCVFFVVFGVATYLGVQKNFEFHGLIVGLVLGVIVAPLTAALVEKKEGRQRTPGTEEDIAELLRLYIDGKMKRFTLLFGVNGGAFAIVQLLTDKNLPGHLSIPVVAAGAVLFTVIMTLDIWSWGWFMRRKSKLGNFAFTALGQIILLLIGGLISAGWILAGME